jgi:hypothetical protein
MSVYEMVVDEMSVLIWNDCRQTISVGMYVWNYCRQNVGGWNDCRKNVKGWNDCSRNVNGRNVSKFLNDQCQA